MFTQVSRLLPQRPRGRPVRLDRQGSYSPAEGHGRRRPRARRWAELVRVRIYYTTRLAKPACAALIAESIFHDIVKLTSGAKIGGGLGEVSGDSRRSDNSGCESEKAFTTRSTAENKPTRPSRLPTRQRIGRDAVTALTGSIFESDRLV